MLYRPYGKFANNLAHCACAIIPKESFNSNSTLPIGAGPFKVVEIDSTKCIFEKFEDYTLDVPIIDRIEVSFEKPKDIIQDFKNGKYDYIYVSGKETEKLEDRAKNIQIAECISSRYMLFNFHSKNPIVHSKEARQAINYCLDRKNIVKTLLKGIDKPCGRVFPKSLLENSTLKEYTYNISKAKFKC